MQVRVFLELATGLALLGAAVALVLHGDPGKPDTLFVNVGNVPGLNLGQGPDALVPAGPVPETGTPVVPERIRIPSLEVDAPVVPIVVDPSGVLEVPPDPQAVGWWAEGAQPGAGLGTSILAGHVNSATLGPGALAHLSDLRLGEGVIVVGGGQELHFRIEALRQYPKNELPATEAFSQAVEGRLAIVSCGGQFNRRTGHYLDNVIAYAVPV
ncbi:MAG: class F sortase [Acidimicrobiales bacterium]